MKLLNAFRLTMTLLGGLTLIGACRVVQAQEPERKAIIKFDAVTHYTDGTTIPAGKVISYRDGLPPLQCRRYYPRSRTDSDTCRARWLRRSHRRNHPGTPGT